MKRLVLIRESSQGEGILATVAAHLGMDPNGYKKSLFTRHSKMKTTTIQALAELESKGSGLRFEVALSSSSSPSSLMSASSSYFSLSLHKREVEPLIVEEVGPHSRT